MRVRAAAGGIERDAPTKVPYDADASLTALSGIDRRGRSIGHTLPEGETFRTAEIYSFNCYNAVGVIHESSTNCNNQPQHQI